MIVFAHNVIRRVCRQLRDLVDDDEVIRTAAAVQVTRDSSHKKHLVESIQEFMMSREITDPAGPLALAGCLRVLKPACSLFLNKVFYGRDGSWEVRRILISYSRILIS